MGGLVFTHPACLRHDTGPHHPERPARLESVLAGLRSESAPAGMEWREASLAPDAALASAHSDGYVAEVFAAVPESGLAMLDGDTILSAGSGEAARRAAGAAIDAVDAVVGGETKRAFCAVRPPGHHAEPNRPMGFCLFNNVGIGALHAQRRHGLGRVAVLDFDVHHGNGTQALFWDHPDLLFASSHQSPLYPGTGQQAERGGSGNVVNAPLPPGAGSAHFRNAWETKVLPAVEAFAPELIVISAGFDAHAADPLANMELGEDDYAWVTEAICALAERVAQGRVVSSLEGGYDLDALAASTLAHCRALFAA